MTESQEKLVRQKLIAALGKSSLKSFYELRPGRVAWTFAHIWLGIAGALALGLWAWGAETLWLKFLIPLAVFYIGTRQNAIAVQIHEAAHNLLFAGRRFNDAFCNFCGAYWVLNDVESYRRVHLVHHTDLHLDSDPDRELYELSRDGGRFQLTKLILQDLLWITAVRRIFAYSGIEGKGTKSGGLWHMAAKVGCQAVLLGTACAFFGWRQAIFFYFTFWLVPLFSIFPAIVRLRIVAEHFSPMLDSADRPFVSRTTCTHPVEIYLFGCDMEYHFEHHLLPAIPHPQLARLHTALVEKGFFQALPSTEDHLSGGYLRFWGRLLSGSQRKFVTAPIVSV